MEKAVSMTTVLTAAGVLLFLAPALPAQDRSDMGQSGSGSQSGQSGTSNTGRRSRTHASSEAQSSTSSTGTGTLSAADQRFIKEAAQGGASEVQLGQLAQEKGASDQVKQFGKRMVDDHGKANEELKNLASQKSVSIEDKPNAKDQATYDRLSKLSGAEFDRAYMREMEKDHNKDISEFQKEARSGKDADVKQWADKTLSTLKEHNHLAHQTMAGLRGSEAGTSASTGATGTTTGDTSRRGDRSTTSGDQPQKNPR